MRNRKRPVRAARKSPYFCSGGPFDGATLWLTSSGTLTFAAKGTAGHYDRSMRWVPATA